MQPLPGAGFSTTVVRTNCGLRETDGRRCPLAESPISEVRELLSYELPFRTSVIGCRPAGYRRPVVMRLPHRPKPFTVHELQNVKQDVRADFLTLWPSHRAWRAAGVHAERGRTIIPVSIPRGLLKKRLALFVFSFLQKR